jgi:hypothetical protein
MRLRATLHAAVAIITVSMILSLVATVRAATPVSVPTPQVMPNGAVLRPTTRTYGLSLNFTKIEWTDLDEMRHLTGSGQTDPTATSPALSTSEGFITFSPPGALPTQTNYLAQLELTRTAPGSDLYTVMIPRFDIFGGVLDSLSIIRESPTLVSGGFATLANDPSGVGHLLSLELSVYFESTIDGGQTWDPATGPLGFELTAVPEPAFLALLTPSALLLKRRRA